MRAVINVALVGGLVVTSGCSRDEPQKRFRLLVDVDTPEGLRSGVGVIGYTRRHRPSIQSPTGVRLETRVDAEAVAVDMPDGRTLYMLHTQRGFPDHLVFLLARLNPGRDKITLIAPEDYPTFVMFSNPLDPASVRQVDPAALDAAFGRGYRLLRVAVAITKDPISRTIIDRLPWVKTVPDKLSDRSAGGFTLADSLTALDFYRKD
jgi:hypothetical protein